MKKSFKKLGFVSLAASGVLLGSMNATNLETYAALQKSSHVFGNYAKKDKGKEKDSKKEDNKSQLSTGPIQGGGKDSGFAQGSGSTPTPPAKKDETSGSGDKNQHTASSGTPAPLTPPAKKDETSGGTSGSSVASQLTKDTTMVNNFKSVSVSGMNTTLSGVETMSKQTATISNLLSGNPNLGSVIPNAQGLNSAFSALESAQNTLKGYLNSSSATIGQLTNGSNAVVGALDKAINQVDMALTDLTTADTQKTQAVVLAAASDSATTTTDAINFLNA
ncbi:hypothetical protein JQ297_06045, partial [Helicobacter pylori]|nr:hypothetical protein [Helicobacter pylori]